MLKIEGDRSGGYSGKLDEPIVHWWGVQACCLALPEPEPVQVPGLGWQIQNTSRQNQQDFFHQNKAVRIDWPVDSSDMPTIDHAKDIFGQMVWRIILALRNNQALDAALQEESRLNPRYQTTRIMQNKCKSSSAADGGHTRYLVTEGIIIF